jgi:hypothetical protein
MVEALIGDLFAEAKVALPRERAREIYLLLEGATALILVHGDRAYAVAAGKAAKMLVRQKSQRKQKKTK